MRRLDRTPTLLRLLALAAALPGIAAAASPLSASAVVSGDLGRKLDTYLTRLSGAGFSGAILVAKDGDILLSKGYGTADRSRGIPVTEETVFSIGSITKQFTAAAILKLEMQGKLRVSDPISKYLPGVPPDKSDITIHHLLTHTAGLESDYGRGDFEPVSRDEIVKRVMSAPLRSKPGETNHYSNAGYSLAAAIIEIVTGGSYESFLQESLFNPAGMTRTGYLAPHWDKDSIAVGYRDGEEWGTILSRPWAPDGPWWNLRGNGGIHSTVGDMYRWHLALQGESILSKEAKEKLFTPHVREEGGDSFYGYGWAIFTTPRGTKLVAHNGGNGIFAADFRRYVDEGIVYFIASNAEIHAIEVSDLIDRQIFGGDVPLPPEVKKLGSAALARLAGTYALPSGSRLVVDPAPEGGLRIAADGPDAVNLLAGGTEADVSLAKRLNERVATMIAASHKGNYQPIADAFHGHMPTESIRERETQMARRQEGRFGTYKGFEILGTTRDSEHMVTSAKLSFERGALFIRYLWAGDELDGIRLDERAPGVVFLPVSATEFVSFSLNAPARVRVGFPATGGSKQGALVVHAAGGDQRAERR
jgi:CubicO group peptidase (beta-lactamase class C family)